MADNLAEKQPLINLNDPFQSAHERHWGLYKPPWIWPFKLVLGILLFVPRIITILVILVIAWLLCCIATAGAKIPMVPEDPPLSKWRSQLVRITCRICARVALFCMGFIWIVERRYEHAEPGAYDREKANLIVSNHLGYTEIVYLVGKRAPSFVAKKAVYFAPIIGTIAAALQALFVSRENADSRAMTAKQMAARSSEEGRRRGFPPVMVFPEGTTTQNTHVLTLQPGVFRLGRPVHVYSIKAPFKYFSPAWGQESALWHALFLLLQPYNRLIVTDCGIVTPTEAEKADPRAYAERVQQIMADASGLQMTGLTCYDGPALAHMKRRSLKKQQSQGELAVANMDATKLTRKVSLIEAMAGVPTSQWDEQPDDDDKLETGTSPADVMVGYWERRQSRSGMIAP